MEHSHSRKDSPGRPYLMLTLNLLISIAIMYFSMIDGWPEFFHNLNMFYMALTMAAPMAILMILMMPSMYPNRRANLAILAGFAVVFGLAFLGIRQQAAIGDTQFLRSMIPHHSGAILMCREAKLSDPEIRQLCGQIIRSQRQEIEQMKQILARI